MLYPQTRQGYVLSTISLRFIARQRIVCPNTAVLTAPTFNFPTINPDLFLPPKLFAGKLIESRQEQPVRCARFATNPRKFYGYQQETRMDDSSGSVFSLRNYNLRLRDDQI